MTVLEKLIRLEKNADDFGFMWHEISQLFAQIRSECDEIEENIKDNGSRAHLQEEIGDLLHAAFSLCLFLNLDPKETLEQSVDKFECRYQKLKSLVTAAGYENLKGQPVEVLMDFWNKAKKETS